MISGGMTMADIIANAKPVRDRLDPISRAEVDRARSNAGGPHGNPKAYTRKTKHKEKY